MTRARWTAAFIVTIAAFCAAILVAPVPNAYAATDVPPISITAVYPNGEPQLPELSSKAALLIDSDTGEVIFAQNPDERLPMASTTKIMTAIVVLESLDLDEKVVVSRNAHDEHGSVVGLYFLDTVTVEQLLYWLLVFSGNDAAVALAEKTSGTVDKFVAEMNAKADEMGLTNTHFVNANGLDRTGHYSSCTDLAAMARYAMQNETFRKIVKTVDYDLPHSNSYTPDDLHNSNALLAKYDWITGVKTGSTPTGGYCMVASGTRDGVSLVAVQLGAKDDATRWADVEALFAYGFGLRPITALAQPGHVIAHVPLGDPLDQSVELVPKERLITRLNKGQTATGTLTLSGDLSLPIRAGQVLGTVEFSLEGESLGRTDLVARCAVYVPTLRRILVNARNWYLPEFQLSDRHGRYPY